VFTTVLYDQTTYFFDRRGFGTAWDEKNVFKYYLECASYVVYSVDSLPPNFLIASPPKFHLSHQVNSFRELLLGLRTLACP
jgi:hypothetical protein